MRDKIAHCFVGQMHPAGEDYFVVAQPSSFAPRLLPVSRFALPGERYGFRLKSHRGRGRRPADTVLPLEMHRVRAVPTVVSWIPTLVGCDAAAGRGLFFLQCGVDASWVYHLLQARMPPAGSDLRLLCSIFGSSENSLHALAERVAPEGVSPDSIRSLVEECYASSPPPPSSNSRHYDVARFLDPAELEEMRPLVAGGDERKRAPRGREASLLAAAKEEGVFHLGHYVYVYHFAGAGTGPLAYRGFAKDRITEKWRTRQRSYGGATGVSEAEAKQDVYSWANDQLARGGEAEGKSGRRDKKRQGGQEASEAAQGNVESAKKRGRPRKVSQENAQAPCPVSHRRDSVTHQCSAP